MQFCWDEQVCIWTPSRSNLLNHNSNKCLFHFWDLSSEQTSLFFLTKIYLFLFFIFIFTIAVYKIHFFKEIVKVIIHIQVGVMGKIWYYFVKCRFFRVGEVIFVIFFFKLFYKIFIIFIFIYFFIIFIYYLFFGFTRLESEIYWKLRITKRIYKQTKSLMRPNNFIGIFSLLKNK